MKPAALVVAAVMVSACAADTAQSSTTAVAFLPPTSTSSPTATVAEKTDTEAGKTILEIPRRVDSGVVYELAVGDVQVRFEPPIDGWELLDYSLERSFAGALFGWRGPTGFKSETLDLLVFDVGDSLEGAWDRIGEQGARGADVHGQEWDLFDTGTHQLAGVDAEWREFRTPVLPPAEAPGFEEFHIVQDYIDDVWGNTSVRFYVVPVDEFTITLAYESRCACTPNPHGLEEGDQIADESENELSMWIPELEAFLAAMSFEVP